MRRILSFDCDGSQLAATLDEAAGDTGLLIVSGGNEIRIGAHRGMARLAADIATAGYPVFRFDRRGIGESEEENGGFTTSAPDIAAALTAFKNACPAMTRTIAFGNCDAATALLLHHTSGIDTHVLANVWVVEPDGDLPSTAAIRARYRERLKDPRSWVGLFTGAINLRKLAGGLLRIATPQPPALLVQSVAAALNAAEAPIIILLAARDGTAIAFADAWNGPLFATARARTNIGVKMIDSASHSFANESDYAALYETIIDVLSS